GRAAGAPEGGWPLRAALAAAGAGPPGPALAGRRPVAREPQVALAAAKAKAAKVDAAAAGSQLDLTRFAAASLKQSLKGLGLQATGAKAELVARLQGGADGVAMGRRSVVQLRSSLKALGLSGNGKKEELVARLIEAIGEEVPAEDAEASQVEEVEEKEEEEEEEVEEVEEEDVDLASLPSDQLKVRLKRLGLPQSGKKADLVARLREAAAEEAAQEEGDEAVSEDDGLDSLSGAVLKERLKKLGLPVSGRKAELVARLREAASEGEEEVEAEDEVEEGDDDEEQEDEDLDSLRVDELKVRLKRLGLSMSGKKAELVARLREEGTEAVEEDEDEDDEEDEGEVQRAGGGSDWLKKGADVDVKHENVWYTCKVLDVQEGGELVTVLYYDGEDEEEGVEVSKRVRALRPTWVKEGMKVEVDSEEVF
ncbi:unnamed protein product, partial [Prorocentrum cordatum]